MAVSFWETPFRIYIPVRRGHQRNSGTGPRSALFGPSPRRGTALEVHLQEPAQGAKWAYLSADHSIMHPKKVRGLESGICELGVSHSTMTTAVYPLGLCGWNRSQPAYFEEFSCIESKTTPLLPPATQRDALVCATLFSVLHQGLAIDNRSRRRLRKPLNASHRPLVGAFQPTPACGKHGNLLFKIASALEARVILFQCPKSSCRQARALRILPHGPGRRFTGDSTSSARTPIHTPIQSLNAHSDFIRRHSGQSR